MKNLFVILFVSLLTSTSAMADLQLKLDDKVNSVFNEGVQTELSPEDIKSILPWAENSMTFLKQALLDTQGMPLSEQEKLLLHCIKNVVLGSAPKNSELLMRYVLNRGLRVHWLLQSNTSAQDAMLISTKIRILKLSMEMAMKYWEMDLKHLKSSGEKIEPIDFATFGFEYSQFLYNLNKSILDASAQFVILKTTLGLLQWDLYRDSKKSAYAVDIKKINDSLKVYPANMSSTDQNFLVFQRRLKKVYLGLEIVQKHMTPPPPPKPVERYSSLKGEWHLGGDKLMHCYRVGADTGAKPIDDHYCKGSPIVGVWNEGEDGTTRCYPKGFAGANPLDEKYCKKSDLVGEWLRATDGSTVCFRVGAGAGAKAIDKYFCRNATLKGEWTEGTDGVTRCYPAKAPGGTSPIDNKYCR